MRYFFLLDGLTGISVRQSRNKIFTQDINSCSLVQQVREFIDVIQLQALCSMTPIPSERHKCSTGRQNMAELRL